MQRPMLFVCSCRPMLFVRSCRSMMLLLTCMLVRLPALRACVLACLLAARLLLASFRFLPFLLKYLLN